MPHDDKAIREALATSLLPLGIRVSPYSLNKPDGECAYVIAGPINYAKAMGNKMAVLEYRVVVLVPYDTALEVDVATQARVADYRAVDGATSVKALLESDPYLGGAADDSIVTEAPEPSLYVAGTGATFLVCEFTVEVTA